MNKNSRISNNGATVLCSHANHPCQSLELRRVNGCEILTCFRVFLNNNHFPVYK